MYAEAELLPLSGLQHLAFCERQWALIHIEQQWADNRLTAEGNLLHAIVDQPNYETRQGTKAVRALPLRSLRLGLSGQADIVEFPSRLGGAAPVPIEYKRGKPKPTPADEVQLCAQALCLEEMLQVNIAEGHLYYHQTRHRHSIQFDGPLRDLVGVLALRMHQLYDQRQTPRAEMGAKCRNCSLLELCQPQWLLVDRDPWARWQEYLRSLSRDA